MKVFLKQLKHYIQYGFLGPFLQNFIIGNKRNKIEQVNEKRRIFVLQTPTHGNLGDHGIAYAQKDFLLNNIKDCQYIEISFEEVFKKAKMIKKNVRTNDLIVIHGGGNMGDMYLYEELTRRFIVSYFKNVRIISFPQTISFSDTFLGKIALMGTKKVYKSNKNFFIVARETKSYQIMKKEFGEEKVFLSPDIVFSLNLRGENSRNGIVTCFRNDLEQKIDNNFKENLIIGLEKKYQNIIVTDSIVKHRVSISQRNEELQNIWNTFRNAEVVLTDRLHGMIFCVITGTPCIVFNNFNHKIEYSYKNWLTHLDYIKFTNNENVDQVIELIEYLKVINQVGNIKEGINYENFSTLISLVSNSTRSKIIREIS
ncbi:polysaccharide pyruvyl transferase family protein [Neobacillus sp. FSL H8-0543]|uniref:polysaccharide pyruvyl transferase family protein n=1 Tax=Neobacillus sp. FSL H8-0543 TaxID=2954672 RepID=UPI003158080E